MQKESDQRLARVVGRARPLKDVADAIARAIEHPVPEVYPYRKSRGLVLLNAIAPGFTDRIVQRFGWGRRSLA